jgi:hypothetical protein
MWQRVHPEDRNWVHQEARDARRQLVLRTARAGASGDHFLRDGTNERTDAYGGTIENTRSDILIFDRH